MFWSYGQVLSTVFFYLYAKSIHVYKNILYWSIFFLCSVLLDTHNHIFLSLMAPDSGQLCYIIHILCDVELCYSEVQLDHMQIWTNVIVYAENYSIQAYSSHKSQNGLENYPKMHFVTEMCTHVQISVTKWCIMVYETGTLWDTWN